LIIDYLKDGPKTSKEVQDYFEGKIDRGYVRCSLSKLYLKGKLVRVPLLLRSGYIYALPEHNERLIDKLKEVIPASVKNALNLLMNQRKIFVLNELVEETHGSYETMEYYLDRVFSKQLNWIKYTYYKSFKIYWNAKYSKEELITDLEKEISEIHRKIKIMGDKFEKEVEELLDDYLLNLPFKIEKTSAGTQSGKFFDLAYKLYLFGDIKQPIHLKVEIKNHIPNLNEVTYFWRKTREFRFGSVIPIIIAPAFPSVVYKSFGDILYLVKYDKLKEFVENLKISLKS
jgi:hypothetical protein